MVRECRPPAREPARSWLARRSTMATSTPANASSPANISPVGPASGDHHRMLGHRHTPIGTSGTPTRASTSAQSGGAHTRTSAPSARQLHRESHHRFDVPARPIRRQQHTHFGTPISVVLAYAGSSAAGAGSCSKPLVRHIYRVEGSGFSPLPLSSAVDQQPPREAARPNGSSRHKSEEAHGHRQLNSNSR